MINAVDKFVRFCSSDFGRKILEKETNYLYKELRDYKRILDIGCGIGQFEERLSQLNITGLDNSEAMLEEARKRSDKGFVLGNGERLEFPDWSFDAIVYITTLEFVDDYKKAINEAVRVLEPKGKLVVMMLNPESEYFKAHMQKEDSYFRRMRHKNLQGIERYISRFFSVHSEYFLGIKGQEVFDSHDPRFASLYVIKGIKKDDLPKLLQDQNI